MKSLKIQYAIFSMLVIVALISIILSQKMFPILSDKVDKKLTQYIEDNYKDKDLVSEKTIYKDNKYQKKVYNKDNKYLYFTIYYKDKEIKDNYKKEYVEGNTFLKHISKIIEKDIKNKTKFKTKVSFLKTLNNYNDDIKDRLIKEKNIQELSIYKLNMKLKITYDKKIVSNRLKEIINILNTNNIKPKEIVFEITNEKDITKTIEISIFDTKLLEDEEFEEDIDAILNKKPLKVTQNDKIKYRYLN